MHSTGPCHHPTKARDAHNTMLVQVPLHASTCMHTFTHACTQINTHARMHALMHTNTHAHTHIHTQWEQPGRAARTLTSDSSSFQLGTESQGQPSPASGRASLPLRVAKLVVLRVARFAFPSLCRVCQGGAQGRHGARHACVRSRQEAWNCSMWRL